MLDVYWLLRVCIRTIEHADSTGSLFAFMPEFYLNVAMNSYSALKNYFSPSNCMEELPGHCQLLPLTTASSARILKILKCNLNLNFDLSRAHLFFCVMFITLRL